MTRSDPPSFVYTTTITSKKPLVLIFDDEERFAVVEEPILGCFFRLEAGKGSIFVSVEDSEGFDIVPVVPNKTTPPSWNLPHLTSGRYVVYGLCTKEDRGAWTSNVNPTCSPRGITSVITQGHSSHGNSPVVSA
ncbi:hypothetical protein R1sor_018091 [Riccia sorocarpa]|uniref:Uncharacterized protein n=1 Tax=Riccia sorocarpa TaxID=122646 RepID=A0ABD3IEY5_9MARC